MPTKAEAAARLSQSLAALTQAGLWSFNRVRFCQEKCDLARRVAPRIGLYVDVDDDFPRQCQTEAAESAAHVEPAATETWAAYDAAAAAVLAAVKVGYAVDERPSSAWAIGLRVDIRRFAELAAGRRDVARFQSHSEDERLELRELSHRINAAADICRESAAVIDVARDASKSDDAVRLPTDAGMSAADAKAEAVVAVPEIGVTSPFVPDDSDLRLLRKLARIGRRVKAADLDGDDEVQMNRQTIAIRAGNMAELDPALIDWPRNPNGNRQRTGFTVTDAGRKVLERAGSTKH